MYTSKMKKNDIEIKNDTCFNMNAIFDDIYSKSCERFNFSNLMQYILNDDNLRLAYRNLKSNKIAYIKGNDGLTIEDIGKMSEENVLHVLKSKLNNFNPKIVKEKKVGLHYDVSIYVPSIWDSLIQQALLQVIEPITEARFHPNSYGSRPVKNSETAMAQAMKLIQLQKLYYVVDINLDDFSTAVNHNKLISQLWNMGIRDKIFLSVIKKMLKATVQYLDNSKINQSCGLAHMGVLKNVLTNVALNDFDWWIDSQWASFPTKKEYACFVHENGSINRAHKFSSLRNYSKLKEVFIVRYINNVKLFCRNLEDAQKIGAASVMWLNERLKLNLQDVDADIINLKSRKTNFLGFTIGTTFKGKKRICVTHIHPDNVKRIQDSLIRLIKMMGKPHNKNELFLLINQYNSTVMKIHNYYKIATCVYLDLEPVQKHIHYLFANRLGSNYNRKGSIPKNSFYRDYADSKQIRFIHQKCVLPIGAIKNVNAKFPLRIYNKYTKEGREAMNRFDSINYKVLHHLLNQPYYNSSVNYRDNQISLYIKQKGKCKITDNALEIGNMHCHHKTPLEKGGTDDISNLIYICADVHKLIHASNEKTINILLEKIKLNSLQLTEINKLRKKCDLKEISI